MASEDDPMTTSLRARAQGTAVPVGTHGQTPEGQTPAKELLTLDGISKAFSGVRALSDVSLTCYAGEIHALVGENGAGKSTLIKVAAGSLRADSGSVTINGTPLSRPSPLRARRLGLLTAYQDTSLVPH